jgi:hypothetical protein
MVLWANKLALLGAIPGVNVYFTLALAITALLAAQFGNDINWSPAPFTLGEVKPTE